MTPPHCRIVPAPSDIRPFGRSPNWTAAQVDYENHPAYRSLIHKASPGARLRAAVVFATSMVPLLVKRLVRYERIPHDIRTAKTAAGRLRFLAACLRNLVAGKTGVRGGASASAASRRLAETGCLVLAAPADRFRELDAAAQPEFAALAAGRGEGIGGGRAFDESRAEASRLTAARLFDCIERTFEETGVMEAASAYLGWPARLIDVNPQINDESDSFWREIFPDLEQEGLPAAAYCHRDASGGDLKAMIYFSDVGERNGPFNYAIGSHRLRISRLDNLICEANDHNGLSGTGPSARALFAALPRRLRQKGAFGNDLVDGAPLSAEIVASLWPIEGPTGSIVLFDTKGIHRGGMVIEGERRVITCVIG